jgi:hypothetical protein
MNCKHAYGACNEIVASEAGYTDFLQSARVAAEKHAGVAGGARRTCKQRTGNLCTLYPQAREVLPAFNERMDAIVTQLNGVFPGAVTLQTSPTKHLYRCMEKMCLKGGAQRYKCFNICDIVRCIIVCENCEQMSAVLRAVLVCRDIRVIRVKDRSNQLTSMNWMDIMINIVLVADKHVHVCEIQVVHAKMMLARKGLGGHGPYAQARAATEIIEVRKMHSRKASAHAGGELGDDLGGGRPSRTGGSFSSTFPTFSSGGAMDGDRTVMYTNPMQQKSAVAVDGVMQGSAAHDETERQLMADIYPQAGGMEGGIGGGDDGSGSDGHHDVLFGEGPLGMGILNVDNDPESTSGVAVTRVTGQAEELGVQVGDVFASIGGEGMRGKPQREITAALRAGERPLAVKLLRPSDTPGASTGEHKAPKQQLTTAEPDTPVESQSAVL